MSQQAAQGFFELAHHNNLFEELINLGKTVVSNKPASDPRSGGGPPGQPPLHSFLGVPIFKGSTVVAVIAVANRPGRVHRGGVALAGGDVEGYGRALR
jgi:GAF domain-containing protein